MLKKIKILFLVFMMMCLILLSRNYQTASVFGDSSPWGNVIIVLDAGHGGIDSGCTGNGYLEKDITLAISKETASLLRACGIYTITTRDEDIALKEKKEDITYRNRWRLDLKKRVEIAEEANAIALVSIHINSIRSSKWRGAQVFYDPNKVESKFLADTMQKSLNIVTKGKRLSNTGDYYITRESSMPSIIVEAGFLSNTEEAHLLASEQYQKKIAWAIVSGIIKWLDYNIISQ